MALRKLGGSNSGMSDSVAFRIFICVSKPSSSASQPPISLGGDLEIAVPWCPSHRRNEELTFPEKFRRTFNFGWKAFVDRTIERGLFQDGAVR